MAVFSDVRLVQRGLAGGVLALLLGAACGGKSGVDFYDETSAGAGGAGGGSGGSRGGGGPLGGSGPSRGGTNSSTGGTNSNTGGTGVITGGATSTGGFGTGAFPGAGGFGGSFGFGGGFGSGGFGAFGGFDRELCERAGVVMSRILAAAQSCDPASQAVQCTGVVLDFCGCPRPVEDPISEAAMLFQQLSLLWPAQCPIGCTSECPSGMPRCVEGPSEPRCVLF